MTAMGLSRILSRRNQLLLLLFTAFFVVSFFLPKEGVVFSQGLVTFLPVHSVLEIFSIIVSALIFVVALENQEEERSLNTIIVSAGFLSVALIDLGHMLSYPGMPDLVTPAAPNKSIFFWLVGRLVVSASLLYMVLSRPLVGVSIKKQYGFFAVAILFSGLIWWVGLYHLQMTTLFFVEGNGLTNFKVLIEGVVVAGLVTAWVMLIRRSANLGKSYDVENILMAVSLMIMSEAYLMSYKSVSDLFSFTGHAYKAIAYVFFYRALFRQGFQKPFTMLSEKNRELEVARSEANAAYIAKSQFLANMSHEIRTPMNSILGMAELLEDSSLTADQAHYVSVLKSAGEHLLNLVTNVLDLSRIEAGFLDLHPEEFDLHAAVGRMEKLMAVTAAKKKLPVNFHLDQSLPRMVIGDMIKLNRIVFNLVGNAIKFTDQGSIEVDFRAQSLKDKELELLVTVKDTGTGIPADKINLLFQNFSQVDPSTTRRHGGTGLGLAISKKLAEAMGGTISVQSQTGVGSEFKFTVRLQIP